MDGWTKSAFKRPACPAKFDLLDDKEKEEKKVTDIKAERDARALTPAGDEYWIWLSAQVQKN